MRSLWEGLYKDLSRAATTHRAQSDFENLKTRHPELADFQDPAQLLDHLSTPGLGKQGRDTLLRALVQDAQVAGGSDSIAMRLLWLGHPNYDAGDRTGRLPDPLPMDFSIFKAEFDKAVMAHLEEQAGKPVGKPAPAKTNGK